DRHAPSTPRSAGARSTSEVLLGNARSTRPPVSMPSWSPLLKLAIFTGALVAASGAGPSSVDEAARAEQLLRRWAPTYVQHVDADDAGADRPTRVDFDGDWDTTNNWDNQARFGTALPPAAYGAAILTRTHAYLTFTLYYPRDW